MPFNKSSALIGSVLLGAVLLLLILLFCPAQPPQWLHGETEVRELRLASKVAGRVARLNVTEGQQVVAGEPLFELDSPELTAKLAQARAAEQAADAMRDKAETGLRSEEIDMARLDWQRAQVQQRLAETTLGRIRNLHQEGLISRQQLDETQAQWQASADQAKAAEAKYQLAMQGARSEERHALQAQHRQAAAAVAEVEAYKAETRLTAPVAGEISAIIVHEGELAPAGYPVVTLIIPDDIWVNFNIREDRLVQFTLHSRFTAHIPALDKRAEFEVTKINALPSFASWKQVSGTPGYDLKTFKLEARPLQPIDGLRAGMTVITQLAP